MNPKLKKKIDSFDWKDFSDRLTRLFSFFSKYSRIPINSDRWEEFIYLALRDMNEKYQGELPRWDAGSHSPGADIWIDKFILSAKSGAIKNNILILSSYRLTRFSNLREMVRYLDSSQGKNFDFYLCCTRVVTKYKLRYTVFLVDAEVVKASALDWQETFLKKGGHSSGWRGMGKKGLVVEIRKKMSNQVWLYLPLNLCHKILEFELPLEKWGATKIPF